jgi:histidine triad (HIT) family protein
VKKHPAVGALRKAAQGLTFPSESEAKLEPFLWEGGGDMTPARLLQLAGAPADTPVEEVSLEDFFRVVPQEDRPNFDRLAKVLRQQLSGVKVYKVGGEAEKQAYIVGKTPDGHWAGLKTTVVET